MSIGQRVKSLRKERGLSQTELSKRIGIDQTLISYLESGKGTGSSHIASLAHALGVNAHWLETGQGSPELNYTQPVVVEKSYCKEIEEAIRLMESSDDRGRLKMLIALQDAYDSHKAFRTSLPVPHVPDAGNDRIEEAAHRRLGEEFLAKVIANERAALLVQELMPEILDRVKMMENEKNESKELTEYAKQLAKELLPKALEGFNKSPSDVYLADKQEAQDRDNKHH